VTDKEIDPLDITRRDGTRDAAMSWHALYSYR